MADGEEDLHYNVVASRRQAMDSLLWQTPVLSLTAQAFLLTIALGEGSRGSQLCAALLALTTALASIQLMARHRHNEVLDSKWLEEFETSHSTRGFVGIHARRVQPTAGGPWGWFIRLRSYHVWQATLFAFAIAALAVIAAPCWLAECIVG
jgi:hypothetical protein